MAIINNLLKSNLNKCKCKRLTFQKQKVYELLKSTKTHPRAEDIFNALKKIIPTITLATVYRNLHALANEGKILKLEINKEYRFDADLSNHLHFVCNNCKCIIDLHNNEINSFIKKKLSNFNLEINCINIIVKGICNKCQKEN
ncbi:MAG: Fur family transcriptional regulator [Candidatus Woesearchaeota archaeon]